MKKLIMIFILMISVLTSCTKKEIKTKPIIFKSTPCNTIAFSFDRSDIKGSFEAVRITFATMKIEVPYDWNDTKVIWVFNELSNHSEIPIIRHNGEIYEITNYNTIN